MSRKPYKIQCRCTWNAFKSNPENAAWRWRTWKRYATKKQAKQAMATLQDDLFEFRLVDEGDVV
jgi:hypothetical protein